MYFKEVHGSYGRVAVCIWSRSLSSICFSSACHIVRPELVEACWRLERQSSHTNWSPTWTEIWRTWTDQPMQMMKTSLKSKHHQTMKPCKIDKIANVQQRIQCRLHRQQSCFNQGFWYLGQFCAVNPSVFKTSITPSIKIITTEACWISTFDKKASTPILWWIKFIEFKWILQSPQQCENLKTKILWDTSLQSKTLSRHLTREMLQEHKVYINNKRGSGGQYVKVKRKRRMQPMFVNICGLGSHRCFCYFLLIWEQATFQRCQTEHGFLVPKPDSIQRSQRQRLAWCKDIVERQRL